MQLLGSGVLKQKRSWSRRRGLMVGGCCVGSCGGVGVGVGVNVRECG
jgi:hypothetical protein